MRLFIAFEVPKEVHAHLIELQEPLKDVIRGTYPKEFHLTLKFLGDAQPEKAEEVKERLKKVEFDAFECSLDGIGIFPENGNTRVVWVGLEPEGTIQLLQQQVEDALKGLFRQEQSFKPHLTIARVREVSDKLAFRKVLGKLKVKPLRWKVSRINLIESKLSRQGAAYRVLVS